ncbi:hypothetical protein FisN_13Hh258 [Fistulifera solaris]|jgi:pimeloyl-ACP methyl ester carboxylesterase|uniref:AB hydrolase-1 domain-containing protein n=1 Tax=Fistulifera solaris TaxID=1519565 RepID=A0A1Z5KMT1_FISSO|nr:hypothetical protein FisN_13Hh258 [Fistulifera solaris]|eukprot:GAX27650.1 hypothetical protein FisN_13Hh258 [Fistulifera solaris]
MVLGSVFIDLHIPISRWREEWQTQRRVKGVWDPALQRETLILEDGRSLSYFLDGPKDPTLPYVFALHAMFLTGNSFLMTEPPTDCILVCINRPGYEGSDCPVRNFTRPYDHRSFAHDIQQLADHLQVKKFHIMGHSSGGPLALGCAAHLLGRVLSVGLLSSDPEYAHATAPNKKWFNTCCIGKALPFMLQYCLCCLPLARNNFRGVRNDYRMDISPYDFFIERDIHHPVLIYVGENDSVLPVDISRHVHSRLQNCHLEIVPQIGHLGLLRDAVLRDFLEKLVALPDAEMGMAIDLIENGERQDSFEGMISAVHKRNVGID